MEEASDKALEAEKRLQEEQRRCLVLEQQLEVDPARNTSTQKPPLRSDPGEGEHLCPATSPLPPLWGGDSGNIWALASQTHTSA